MNRSEVIIGVSPESPKGIKLNDLTFNDIKSNLKKEKRGKRTVYVGNKEIVIDGKPFVLETELEILEGFFAGVRRYIFSINSKQGELLSAHIDIRPSGIVNTSIYRRGLERDRAYKDRVLPRGAGRRIAFKIWDFVPEEANAERRTLVHEVTREPKQMSDDEWKRIFIPELKARGYASADEISFKWTKTFEPQRIDKE